MVRLTLTSLADMVKPTNSHFDTNGNTMTSMQQHAAAEQALGATALEALRARNLLRRMAGPEVGREPGDRPDRIAAPLPVRRWATHSSVAGAPSARQWLADASAAAVTAVTQGLVLSAETWCDAGWSAPALLSDRFGNVIGGMRRPGEALRRAIAARRRGAAWYQAATRSYGDGALTRAVAVGLVRPGARDELGLAASLDAAVTHASPRATACAAALAGIIAVLVERPGDQSARECIAPVVEAVDHRRVREALRAALAPTELPPTGSPEHGVRPEAIDVLSLALWSALLSDDPAMVLATAAEFSGRHRAAVAVAGALFGAIHGRAALPPRTASLEGADAYTVLAGRIADRLDGGTAGGARIWFLLDRSGSMADIAADVVTGFDRFFADQREVAGDATVTIVQFDDHDPHDVVVDARPIASVPTIAGRFEPAWLHTAVRRDRPAARPRRGRRRRRCRSAAGRHDRWLRECQPNLGPAEVVPSHLRPARPRLDLRVPGCEPGQLRHRWRPRRRRWQREQLRYVGRRRQLHVRRAQPNGHRMARQGSGNAHPRPRRLLGRAQGGRGVSGLSDDRPRVCARCGAGAVLRRFARDGTSEWLCRGAWIRGLVGHERRP